MKKFSKVLLSLSLSLVLSLSVIGVLGADDGDVSDPHSYFQS